MKRSDKQIIKLALTIRKASIDDLVLLCAMCSIRLNHVDDDDEKLVNAVLDCINEIEANKNLLGIMGCLYEKTDA